MVRPRVLGGFPKMASAGGIGRGFVLITGAKVWFLATATLTSLLFPRLFGDPTAFGRFRVVSGVLNVVTMVVITATVQAAARLASEAGADLRAVRSAGGRVQAALFGTVFVAVFALAGPIAGGLLSDPALETPLRVASLVIAAYAWYALLVGILNGNRRFAAQAALDATFSTLKAGLMIAAVVLTASATWAFAGFAAAAFLVLAIAIGATRLPGTGAVAPPGLAHRYAGYLLPLAGYALVLNLLLQADVVAVKAALGAGDGAGDAAGGAGAAADAASFAAGVYGAARNAALLPYQVVIALTFVVFPLVSRSSSEGDHAAAATAAAGATRLAAVLSGAAVAAFGAAPGDVLHLLFGPAYAPAGPALVPLLAASALTALMYVGNAVLASAGHPAASLVGAAAAAAVQLSALAWLLPGPGAAEATYVPAAVATLLGATVGAAATLSMLRRVAPAASWARTVVASGGAAAAGVAVARLPAGMLPWPLACVAAVAVFAAVLAAVRGVVAADLARIRRAFGRGAAGSRS